VRTGASGRQRTFHRLYDRFLPNKYDPPSFALKLGHKDMWLATELGRELGVPMRLANMVFAGP
jgi:3-hydroxyisobutyrate dehydrogenase-like beta-hydroxyacid dehydrogenase